MDSQKPPESTPLRGNKRLAQVFSAGETMIYESRWLIFPINAGLAIALVIYVFKFLFQVAELVHSTPTISTEELMVQILGLVDTAMVANLLVMIIKGSHQIFIRRFTTAGTNKPQWLDHIDSGILKIKVALSIASITLVQLLRDFVGLEKVSWELVEHRLIIHGVALASALAMAVIWRITHTTSGEHHAAHTASDTDTVQTHSAH